MSADEGADKGADKGADEGVDEGTDEGTDEGDDDMSLCGADAKLTGADIQGFKVVDVDNAINRSICTI